MLTTYRRAKLSSELLADTFSNTTTNNKDKVSVVFCKIKRKI